MNTRPYPYKRLLWLPFFLILSIVIYKIDDVRTDAYLDQLKSEYYSIRFKDSINDRVKTILIPKRIRSPQTSYVTTLNNRKVTIWAKPVDHDLRIPEVIQIGSIVHKYQYDSLLIVKNVEGKDTVTYLFKLLNYRTLSHEPEKWEKPLTQ